MKETSSLKTTLLVATKTVNKPSHIRSEIRAMFKDLNRGTRRWAN